MPRPSSHCTPPSGHLAALPRQGSRRVEIMCFCWCSGRACFLVIGLSSWQGCQTMWTKRAESWLVSKQRFDQGDFTVQHKFKQRPGVVFGWSKRWCSISCWRRVLHLPCPHSGHVFSSYMFRPGLYVFQVLIREIVVLLHLVVLLSLWYHWKIHVSIHFQ